MRHKFVEYLGTDFFIFVELAVVGVLNTKHRPMKPSSKMCNARITSYSWCAGGLEADSHVDL
jgi:hypothetical protein